MERWFDFKREFEMEDLSPTSYMKLSQKFLLQSEFAQKYRYWYERNESEDCDLTCQKMAFCETFSSQVDEKLKCINMDMSLKRMAKEIIFQWYSLLTNAWI